MSRTIKIVFMGTPDFALPSLQSLIEDEDFEVQAVVTQEDKKVGRKQELTAPPVKQLALKNNIPVFQPSKIKKNAEFQELMKNLKPDVMVVVSLWADSSSIHSEYSPFWCRERLCLSPAKNTVSFSYGGPLLHGDRETGVTIKQSSVKSLMPETFWILPNSPSNQTTT
ncbi:MAG: formyltransferase family protein [Candidatus Gracilibacteria bacterium]